MKLKVCLIEVGEVYKDRVRIPVQFREGIREGQICKLTTGNRTKLVELRGAAGIDQPHIYMDFATRQKLGLQDGSVCDFEIRPVYWIGQIYWASRSSDPTVRTAAQLAVLSLVLAILSIVIAVAPLLLPK